MIASQDDHERVARETVAQNPDLVRQALHSGNWLPLIRIAERSEPEMVTFWLARRIGQIARGESET